MMVSLSEFRDQARPGEQQGRALGTPPMAPQIQVSSLGKLSSKNSCPGTKCPPSGSFGNGSGRGSKRQSLKPVVRKGFTDWKGVLRLWGADEHSLERAREKCEALPFTCSQKQPQTVCE